MLIVLFAAYSTGSLPNQLTMPVITEQEENDLELFQTASQATKPLFYYLDRTITSLGKHELKNILKNPLTNTDQLIQRQNGIKTLVETALIDTIDKELHIFQRHEYALYRIWQEQDPIHKASLEDLYFNNKRLQKYNTSPLGLNVLHVAGIVGLSGTLLEHMVMHFLVSDKIKETYHIGCNHDHSNDSIKQNHNQYARVAYTLYNIGHLGLHLANIKTIYEHIYQRAQVIKNIQAQLISIHQCIKSMRTLYTIVKNNPSLQSLTHYTAVQNLFEHPHQLDPQDTSAQLIQLLQTNTFGAHASVWSNPGNILAAYWLLHNAHALRNALTFIACLDAHTSIAKLYQERSCNTLRYSYAQYLQQDHPQAMFQDVWNPYLGDTCCTHSMNIGSPATRNMIITGDNASGKSTLIKSLTLAVLLGQTLTIIPAYQACYTPFAKITTSIKHADNIQAGTSLFVTEQLKSELFLESLNNDFKPGNYSFAIFDELFKSTNPTKGEKTAYDFIARLGNIPHNLCLVATHYAQLKNLALQDPTTFTTYTAQSQAPGSKGFTINKDLP